MVDYGRLHVFQSTLPGWGATTRLTRSCIASFYFNPRSPDGERHGTCAPPSYFVENFNPRSPDGERPGVHERVGSARGISIHAPRMGSDAHEQRQHVPHVEISIHAPRMGSDGVTSRTATVLNFISIHAPRMGSDLRAELLALIHEMISIHAPRMGSDAYASPQQMVLLIISIHAPRMGSDDASPTLTRHMTYFNPRSPDGERRFQQRRLCVHAKFQSTLPGWGATRLRFETPQIKAISIHAPRMGSDQFIYLRRTAEEQFQSTLPGWGATTYGIPRELIPKNFNPRSPDGERLNCNVVSPSRYVFQSTLPGWGATFGTPSQRTVDCRFQSTLPGWGATGNADMAPHHIAYFNPRSPDGERPRKWTSSPTIWAKSSIFNTDCIADRR